MKLLLGDCLDKLKELEDNSVDSIVTDPPYGLSFMGKKWDYDVPSVEIWKECLRVLKPGGHLLSFAGSRTYHRMAVRIEDAGFEIRDQIMWIYGSGFPKSMDISKQLDKMSGAEREVIGTYDPRSKFDGSNREDREIGGQQVAPSKTSKLQITAPATDEAKEWNGWGTALKPAHEPIVMARKPLSESTVAENVLEWGTGGINIDESRIGVEPTDAIFAKNPHTTGGFGHGDATIYGDSNGANNYDPSKGRFPANVIFDEEAGRLLDEQSGVSKSSGGSGDKSMGALGKNGKYGNYALDVKAANLGGLGDVGGASRFFYCPKTNKSDRNEGCENIEAKSVGTLNANSADLENYGGSSLGAASLKGEHKNPEPKNNFHPTVKPTDLMLYLIRLVTKKSGTILDPFMGSGSTGKAAIRGGFDFVGIEREKEYFQIAEARIEYEKNRPVSKPIKGNRIEVKEEVKEKINQFFG
jgi:site-specific DNA-methyltransferase (adenine-specific)